MDVLTFDSSLTLTGSVASMCWVKLSENMWEIIYSGGQVRIVYTQCSWGAVLWPLGNVIESSLKMTDDWHSLYIDFRRGMMNTC